MFDSRSLRRKLGSFVPGEGARRQLQNVLTVEWDTHKTVLVDVPGANSQRSPDMEMEGMGLNRRDEREGYGRLDDGEDDYLDSPYSNNPNMGIESTSSGTASYFHRPIARPASSSRSHSYTSEKRLPSIPQDHRQTANANTTPQRNLRSEDALNPFVSIDDFAPSPSSSSFLQPHRPNGPESRKSSARTMQQGWNTFGNDRSPVRTPGQEREPDKEPTSPSSSRGTRDSGQTASTLDENPFR